MLVVNWTSFPNLSSILYIGCHILNLYPSKREYYYFRTYVSYVAADHDV